MDAGEDKVFFSVIDLPDMSSAFAVPLHGNFELRPLGVAMGNAFSVSEDTYVKTPSVGRRQPMTSLPAQP